MTDHERLKKSDSCVEVTFWSHGCVEVRVPYYLIRKESKINFLIFRILNQENTCQLNCSSLVEICSKEELESMQKLLEYKTAFLRNLAVWFWKTSYIYLYMPILIKSVFKIFIKKKTFIALESRLLWSLSRW